MHSMSLMGGGWESLISTCLNYLLIAKHITLHLPHENPVSNRAAFLTNTDWESSLYFVLFILTGVCLVKELGSGWVVIAGVQRIRALPQLKGRHTGQWVWLRPSQTELGISCWT